MKKLWYFLYLALFFGAVYGIVQLTGSWIAFYLDIPSLLIILVFDLLFSVCLYGAVPSGQYFRAVFQKEPEEPLRQQAIRYFRSMAGYTLAVGLMGFILGMIAVLANLEDTSSVGPNLAVGIITVLYAVMVNMAVFIPFRAALERQG